MKRPRERHKPQLFHCQAYIDKYDFEHEVITGAVDEKANVTFSFWQDKVRVADSSDHLYDVHLHESIAMRGVDPS